MPTVAQKPYQATQGYNASFAPHMGSVTHKKDGFFGKIGRRLFSTDLEVGTGRGQVNGTLTDQIQMTDMMAAVDKAKATGDWSAVPPEFRPQSSTAAGRQKLANEGIFQEERMRDQGLIHDVPPAGRSRSNAVSGPKAGAQAKAAALYGSDSGGEYVALGGNIGGKAVGGIGTAVGKLGSTTQTTQASGVMDPVGNLAGSTLGTVSSFMDYADARRDANHTDGAKRVLAERKGDKALQGGVMGLAGMAQGGASKSITIAKAFGDATSATNASLVAAPLDIMVQGAKAGLEGRDAHTHHGHHKAFSDFAGSSAQHDEITSLALGGSGDRHQRQKWVHGTKAGIHAYNAASSAVTLGAAPVGAAMRLAGTVAEGVHGAVDATTEAYSAGTVQDLRRQARFGEAGDGGAAATEALMRQDPVQRAQTLITKAKAGDAYAKAALTRYGITDEMLAKSAAKDLREIIVKAQDTSQNNENIGQKVVGVGKKIGGGITAVRGKLGI